MIFDKKFFTEEIKGHIDHPHFFQRAEWIQEYIKEDSTVYILGCGFGHLVSQLNCMGIFTYGVEISEYAYKNRVSEYVLHESAEISIIGSDAYVFSWNLLDCLNEETAQKLAENLKHIKNQIHVVCCSGDYKGYFIKPIEYWEKLFPNAIIIDYEKPKSELHFPTSWGRVSE